MLISSGGRRVRMCHTRIGREAVVKKEDMDGGSDKEC